MAISSIKLAPFPLPFPKPLSPFPPLFPFKFPLIPSIRAPKTLTHAFYTERTPISAPPPKPKNPNPSDTDDIAVLNERIRRELGKRERSKGGGGQELDSKEAEKYIKLVKQQQQRGLQKLKGDIDGKGSGYGYRVDPYTLRPGDYVVHKKVGIGKFVAIKYDVSAKEGSAAAEPIEYVFIEYGDGMAKLPVKQAAKMLYRYNLPNETKKPRTLSKLNDTSAWEKRRIKGKIAIQKMVVDLMELYLHRLKQKRPPYPKNPAMAEFAAQFPYEPTPDQKQLGCAAYKCEGKITGVPSIPVYLRQSRRILKMADAEFDTGIKAEVVENTEPKDALKGRKSSAKKLRRMDSLQMEAGNVSSIRSHGAKAGWGITMHLAFQSIGVVYGDIGTSPLYVFASTFTDGIKDNDDILGALSLILYTLLLIPLTKYALIVLWANDNGNGGAFALYSLISRYAKVGLLPNQQAEDAMLSNYKLSTPSTQMKRAQWIKAKLESSKAAKVILIFLTILGTSMIMGDGVLTPCISVLSAVSGIQQKADSLTEGKIAIISIIILIMLFSIQRFGIDKVGYAFAPVILLWFSLIGGIGMYNLITYDVRVLRAFNPKYIIDYFRRNGKHGWISLGGVVLCITGAEAMFADLGHFNVRAIQISFTAVLLPSVSLAYIGQAAYLTKFPENVANTFYKSIPGPLFWPTFVVAVAAAIIASQAVISCVFTIIAQAQTLGCFPRVKVVHTSAKYEGQVYIPELNFALMIACILVTGSFRTTEHIGSAYGIAVICDMTITTCLVTLIMLVIWQKSIWQVVLFFVVFAGAELTYLSSVLSKFVEGGYLPLVFSFFLMQMMAIWHYVHVKRYMFEVENKISSYYIKELAHRQDIKRISGIGFLYSELVEGIPPIFAHFIEKVPSIHSVMVFVSVKHLPISKVELQERFLFRQVEPREYRIYRCVVRYGYIDAIEEPGEFESLLIEQLKNFIHNEYFFMESWRSKQSNRLQEEATLTNTPIETSDTRPQKTGSSAVHVEETLTLQNSPRVSSASIQPVNSNQSSIPRQIQNVEEEQQFIQKEMEKGVVYLLGETEVVAGNNSSIIKRITVNYLYNFMRRNFRQGGEVMMIPRSKLLKVGMTYEI